MLKPRIASQAMSADSSESLEHFISPDKFFSFHHLISVHRYVILFVNKLNKYEHLSTKDTGHNFYDGACKQFIARDQQ